MSTIEFSLNPALEIYRPDFTGRVAVVTGGTSGIGREIVLTLASLGATVHFCGRNQADGAAVAGALPAGQAHYACVDVSQTEEIKQWIEKIPAIDFLINNVANDRRVPMDTMNAEDFDFSLAINLRSHFLVTLAALPAIRCGSGKCIVNVGTCNYMNPEPDCLLYNLGKSGIVGLTRSLARQLGPEYIRVNTFTPGWIATEKQLKNHLTPEAQEKLIQWQCLPQVFFPADIVGPLLFLCSRSAAAVTGQNLLAEGGRVML